MCKGPHFSTLTKEIIYNRLVSKNEDLAKNPGYTERLEKAASEIAQKTGEFNTYLTDLILGLIKSYDTITTFYESQLVTQSDYESVIKAAADNDLVYGTSGPVQSTLDKVCKKIEGRNQAQVNALWRMNFLNHYWSECEIPSGAITVDFMMAKKPAEAKEDNITENTAKLLTELIQKMDARKESKKIGLKVGQYDPNSDQVKTSFKRACKDGLTIFDGNIEGKIHYILDAINLAAVVFKNRSSHGDSISSSELRWMYRNKENVKNVQFWHFGKKVTAPWEDDPALWKCYETKEQDKRALFPKKLYSDDFIKQYAAIWLDTFKKYR
jgi:hypothetical protein